MFKKTTNLLLITWLLFSCQPVDKPLTELEKTSIEQAVNESFAGLVAASKSLDTKRYLEYFDRTRFVGLSANGVIWHSIEALEAEIDSGFSAIKVFHSLEFDRVKVIVLDRATAILVNEYQSEIILNSGETIRGAGGGVQVWSKTDEGWRLVSVSASLKTNTD